MRQRRDQDAFTTGRRRWLSIALSLGMGIAVAYGVAPGSQAAAAQECRQETPLPGDVRLKAPGPEVPEALAQFAGAWSGLQVGPGDSAPICETLVVEEVLANGDARVIFSVGTSAALGVRLPWFVRATGRIVEGELRVTLPLPNLPQLGRTGFRPVCLCGRGDGGYLLSMGAR